MHTMGYLKDFRADITARVEALDTSCREDVQTFVNFITNAVLDSYRNGEKRARGAARKDAQEKRAEKRRTKAPTQ